MQLTAPISRTDEIEAMVAAGARELYCGVLPEEWIARFNTGAVNRRYFGNLRGLESLRDAVSQAHGSGAKLFMVLNAQHYGGAHQQAAVELAGRFRDFGGDAVIVADLALIVEIRECLPDLAIHVSSVAGCRNSAAIDFYRDLGVRRVIVPRDVTLDEIAAMRNRAGAVEVEAFVLNDGCVFEEAVCHSIHLPPQLGGPICLDRLPWAYRRERGRAISERTTTALQQNEADYQRWLWYRFGCGFSVTADGLPFGPCGLCAIPRLDAAGVDSIKIAGRERATEQKVASVKMVRAVLDSVRRGEPDERVRDRAVGLRKVEEHCRTGFMCYYPEVCWREPF